MKIVLIAFVASAALIKVCCGQGYMDYGNVDAIPISNLNPYQNGYGNRFDPAQQIPQEGIRFEEGRRMEEQRRLEGERRLEEEIKRLEYMAAIGTIENEFRRRFDQEESRLDRERSRVEQERRKLEQDKSRLTDISEFERR